MTTEQAKLPEELTAGATVSPLTADQWFTRKKPARTPVPEAEPSEQTTLEQFTEKKGWQFILKARPFMTDAERKFSAKATTALDASVPMKRSWKAIMRNY